MGTRGTDLGARRGQKDAEGRYLREAAVGTKTDDWVTQQLFGLPARRSEVDMESDPL